MSSMTDIVFLLLIFFMLTSTLVTTNALRVDLPSNDTKITKRVENVAITITSDLKYYVDKKPVAEGQLETALLAAMAKNPEASVVLHADRSIPLDNAVKVMTIANKHKYKFVLATTPNK